MAVPLVTVHLFGVTPAGTIPAMARMALDRGELAVTPGLRFAKLLGTGRGRTFTLRDADPLRWAMLGVWDHPVALVDFERRSPVAAAWRRLAAERWRADLRPLRSQGRWSGQEPFTPTDPGNWAGPVAAVTRARLRAGRVRRFRRATPPVSAAAHEAPGLRLAIGIGELPIGLQGTFSVWDDAASMVRFAYRGAAHRRVADATPREGWYAEDLFARFAVLQTTGTVGGVDPLCRSGGEALRRSIGDPLRRRRP